MVHEMLALQADIKMELLKVLPETLAHDSAANVAHIVFTSPAVKEEVKTTYKELSE